MSNRKTIQQYTEHISTINGELAKRKHKWSLASISWMDYDDVSQIIRVHIFRKWHQYDPTRPIKPWLNAIISSQMKNLIRNHYGNYSRPCLRCHAANDLDGCLIYEKQCEKCPLFSDWTKRKLPAHNIKLPVSMEHHENEVHSIPDGGYDISEQVQKLHEKMKEILRPIEYTVYKGLFILNLDESEIAKKLGYISNESGRPPGYKQIKNIRKIIIAKIKKHITSGEIDIF